MERNFCYKIIASLFRKCQFMKPVSFAGSCPLLFSVSLTIQETFGGSNIFERAADDPTGVELFSLGGSRSRRVAVVVGTGEIIPSVAFIEPRRRSALSRCSESSLKFFHRNSEWRQTLGTNLFPQRTSPSIRKKDFLCVPAFPSVSRTSKLECRIT